MASLGHLQIPVGRIFRRYASYPWSRTIHYSLLPFRRCGMDYPHEPPRSNTCTHRPSLGLPRPFFAFSYLNPSLVRFDRYYMSTSSRASNGHEVHLILSRWERDQHRTNEAKLTKNPDGQTNCVGESSDIDSEWFECHIHRKSKI